MIVSWVEYTENVAYTVHVSHAYKRVDSTWFVVCFPGAGWYTTSVFYGAYCKGIVVTFDP